MAPVRRSIKALQKEVDDFNRIYTVGQMVKLRLDSGEIKEVAIRHEATVLGGHTAVGWFEGVSGCYALKNIVK